MFNEQLGVYVAVISASRPFNVKKMELKCGPCTWYVPKGQKFLYEQMHACEVVESGKLCASRNRALEDAFHLGVPCIQLSDDLRKIEIAHDSKRVEEMDFDEAVNTMKDAARIEDAMLVGVAPTANAFYFRGSPVKMNKFIVGDFILVQPCDLRFDENMTLKEDYDYTLQHISQFGKVIRCDNILTTFAHRTNRGGAVEYRTTAREIENIEYLKLKWGDRIGTSRRGPTEITLKI